MKIIQAAILLYILSFQFVAFCMQASNGTQVGHYITSKKIVCFEGDKRPFELVLAYKEWADYFKDTEIKESVTGEQVPGTVSDPQFFFNLETVMGPKYKVLTYDEKIVAIIFAVMTYTRSLSDFLEFKTENNKRFLDLKPLNIQVETNRSKAFYAALFLIGTISAVSLYRQFIPYLQEPFDTIFYLAPLASAIYAGKRIFDWGRSFHERADLTNKLITNFVSEINQKSYNTGIKIPTDTQNVFNEILPLYKNTGNSVYTRWKAKIQAVNEQNVNR